MHTLHPSVIINLALHVGQRSSFTSLVIIGCIAGCGADFFVSAGAAALAAGATCASGARAIGVPGWPDSASRNRAAASDALLHFVVVAGFEEEGRPAVLLEKIHEHAPHARAADNDQRWHNNCRPASVPPAGRPRPHGGRRAALEGRGFANLPQLTGLPQIVGLALGSPEFQRH